MTAGPLAVFVIHRRLEDHRRPPTNRHPVASWSPQGGLIYTAKYNDFLNNSSWKAARACFPRPLDHCHFIQPQRVVRHVSDMTAVRSAGDYLVLFAREENVEGITLNNRGKEGRREEGREATRERLSGFVQCQIMRAHQAPRGFMPNEPKCLKCWSWPQWPLVLVLEY